MSLRKAKRAMRRAAGLPVVRKMGSAKGREAARLRRLALASVRLVPARRADDDASGERTP